MDEKQRSGAWSVFNLVLHVSNCLNLSDALKKDAGIKRKFNLLTAAPLDDEITEERITRFKKEFQASIGCFTYPFTQGSQPGAKILNDRIIRCNMSRLVSIFDNILNKASGDREIAEAVSVPYKMGRFGKNIKDTESGVNIVTPITAEQIIDELKTSQARACAFLESQGIELDKTIKR